MNNKQPSNPRTLVLLSAGLVVVVIIAFWTISSALGPPNPHTQAVHGANPAVASSVSMKSIAPEAQNLPKEQQKANRNSTSGAPAQTDDGLALDVDPFAPLPSTSAQSRSADVPGAKPPGKSAAGTAAAGNQTGGQAAGTPVKPAPANNAHTQGQSSPQPPSVIKKVQEPAAPAPPDLAGTFVGDKPCAVFREGTQQFVTIPVGGAFQNWKVVSVGHGFAIVKSKGRTLRLVPTTSTPPH